MAVISKTIANLINGVSQQPATIRNPTQCEVQENYLSDVTYGNCHRPPSEFVGVLWDNASGYKPHVHTIDRGADSRFKVIIIDGDLKVFDLEGNEKTVSFPNGKTYLDVPNPEDALNGFQCLTIGEETFILNKTKTVTETVVPSDYDMDYGDNCLVFIKQGDYSTSYTVTVKVTDVIGGGVTGPIAVTKTTSDTVIADIRTTQIATDLKTGLDAAFGSKLSTTRSGSVLWLAPTFSFPVNNYDLTGIALEDSKGNNNTRLIRTQVQKLADLPTVAPNYYPVQIVGDKASGFDDYYVRFFPDDPLSSFGNGSWQESWKTTTHYAPTPSTMPLVLTDNGDGTFTCAEGSWDAREAGDTFSNPNPPFVGETITGMFTFGNRLGFLYGGKISMSEVGVYTNFYLTTVVTFLDSDPIHIEELNGFNRWLYAVPLTEKIILFSDNGQAVIKGDGLLTPKTATIEATTRYQVSDRCRPILVGDNVYFASDNGDYSRVYEMFVTGETDKVSASEITSHVPKYIPKGISQMSGDDSQKILVAIGQQSQVFDGDWEFYVYKYFWIGDQKVQSSWSKWILPNANNTSDFNVVDASVFDGVLYLIVQHSSSNDLSLLKIALDLSRDDSATTGNLARTKCHLDCRISGSGLTSYTEDGFRYFQLPFLITSDPDLYDLFKVIQYEDQSGDPRVSWGTEVPFEIIDSPSSQLVRIYDPDNEILENCWFGFQYTSRYTFSEIHLKDEQNGAQVPTEEGKLTLKKISVLYQDSLGFRIEVTPRDRGTRSYSLPLMVIGDPTPLEDLGARSGRFSVPVNAENTKVTISVVNDTVVPHRLQSAEWVGQYSILSRRF